MKHLLSICLLSFFSLVSFAQQNKFTGTWEGDLDAGVQQLRMIFTISQKDDGQLKVTIQAPQQSPAQIPADTVFTDAGKISLEVKRFKMSFSGTLVNDSILSGSFVQGATIPLQLKKVARAATVSKPKRPQTPKPPFAYKSIDLIIPGKEPLQQLGATLTVPDTVAGKKYPAVVLITGSGPQDRDETLFGHKPFAVIADQLTKKGFAVLRVDDRGVGRSTGNRAIATSADFANDTEAAVDYLKTKAFIDDKNLGLIGHSEGGMIAPMVAARRKDIKFIVLLAGPGVPCADLMAEQNVAIFKSNGLRADIAEAYGPMYKKLVLSIVRAKDSAAAFSNGMKVVNEWNATDSVKRIFKVADEGEKKAYVKAMTDELYNPWYRYFVSYDPAPALKKLSCAVLALNGSKDLQVLPASNLQGIERTLKKSKTKNYEIKELPQLNHLFQTCNSCTLNEYSTLEESFSPAALDIMTDWLLKQAK